MAENDGGPAFPAIEHSPLAPETAQALEGDGGGHEAGFDGAQVAVELLDLEDYFADLGRRMGDLMWHAINHGGAARGSRREGQ